MINRERLRNLLPFLSLAVFVLATFYVAPLTRSYFGLNLMLQYAVPIALATIAQMFVITIGDLDLSIGPFVGLVSCIASTLLFQNPALGVFALFLCIAAYGFITAERAMLSPPANICFVQPPRRTPKPRGSPI